MKWFEKAITIDPLNENLQKRIRFVREISNKKASYGDETIYQLINDAHEQMERGNFQEAYQLWQKVVKNGFEDTEVLYNIAYCLWNLGKHSKAIEYCNKVLNRDSLFVHALNIKGNALDDIGDHKSAIECYKKSVEIDPDYYEAWNGMGLSYKAIGDFEQAMKCYEEAIKIKPDFFRAWFNKANLLDDMNKTEDAINAWEETKKIVETEDVWNNLGHCLFKIKKYDEALHAFEQAIRLNPNSAQAWTNKGATLTAMNKFNEAVECFKEALRIKPDFGPAKRNLNRITRSLLQKNKAKTKTDGITPLDVMKYYKKAMDHIEESNYDAVVDNILKAENILANMKPLIGLYNELQFLAVSATLFKKMQKWQEAIIRFEKVCQIAEKLEPSSWETVGDFCDLGFCYKANRQTLDAISTFSKALALAKKIDPFSPYVKNLENEIKQLMDIGLHPKSQRKPG